MARNSSSWSDPAFLKKKVKEPSREDSENLGWNTDDKKKEKNKKNVYLFLLSVNRTLNIGTYISY